MKKTKLLTTLGAVALIGAIGIGSTFAYLTSNTDVVTNSFSVGKVEITLDEKDYDNPTGERVTENDYPNLLPTQTVDKDPTVHVQPQSEESYVFMTVTGAEYNATDKVLETRYITTDPIDAKWEYLGKNADGALVFGYVDTATNKTDKAIDLKPLFKKVTVKSDVTNRQEIGDIVVKAFAIQAYGFASAEEAAVQTPVGVITK